jgi:hypothetical protein
MAGTSEVSSEREDVSLTEILTISLPQLVLWYDSTRIQTWPSLLAQVDPGIVLRSSTDFGRAHFTDRMTDDRHAAAEKITRNMPGLEKKEKGLALRGIGLLETCTGGYRLSAAGCELAEAYRRDPKGNDWVYVLARLLLTREPRTRTLIRLLSEKGATLYFTTTQWWSGSLQRAAIKFNDGGQLAPFAKKDEPLPNLRSAINERSWWALGEWRSDPLVQGANDCRFVGQLKEQFSLHDISLALRASCEVFVQLGVLQHQGNSSWIDQEAAVEAFGPVVAADFGWQETTDGKTSYELLTSLVPELRMDTGFIVASELRRKLLEHGVENPDRDIAQLEVEGRLVIEATDYGQSRHGVGLYDDPSKQLIKLRVC